MWSRHRGHALQGLALLYIAWSARLWHCRTTPQSTRVPTDGDPRTLSPTDGIRSTTSAMFSPWSGPSPCWWTVAAEPKRTGEHDLWRRGLWWFQYPEICRSPGWARVNERPRLQRKPACGTWWSRPSDISDRKRNAKSCGSFLRYRKPTKVFAWRRGFFSHSP